MSVYFKKGKGWRYDFTLDGTRYTQAWFKTKRAATTAENERREAIKNPKPAEEMATQTGMAFLELVNRRLDHVKAYNSERHYIDMGYHCKRWAREWQTAGCNEITTENVESYLIKRLKISPNAANKDLRYLRALFNYGKKKQLIDSNPTDNIDFFPVEKRKKYVPPKEDVTFRENGVTFIVAYNPSKAFIGLEAFEGRIPRGSVFFRGSAFGELEANTQGSIPAMLDYLLGYVPGFTPPEETEEKAL